MRSFTLMLMLSIIVFSAQAQSGIFESYIILDAGSGNTYYDLQATTGNPDFTGSLGSFAQCGGPLLLNGAQNKTFKCPGDDILNGKLWYRVYPMGSPSGAFLEVNLPFGSNLGTGCSGNDQMWQRTDAGINLLANRAPGIYTLEVYTTADFSYTGGGGGSGTHFSSNGGANYSATFTVTGNATCPVFVTASGGTGFASYTTLKGAFDAINAGTHQGVITIDIAANTTETAPAVLNSSGAGSASYASIVIRPSSDGITVSGATATGRGLVELNGADNVTIDGDNPNSAGINRNLTFTNTAVNTVTHTSVIRIAVATSVVTSANNNTIKNCIVNGSATGRNISSATNTSSTENASYGIYVSGGASTSSQTTAPSVISSVSTTVGSGATWTGLVIDNNQVNACARAIYVGGSATSVCALLTVTNNIVGPNTSGGTTSVYSIGITLQGFGSALVAGNIIQNMESFLGTSIRALDFGSISASGTNATVERNIIRKVNLQNTTTFGVYGINIAAGNGFTVRNNFVSDLQSDMTGGSAFTATFGIFGIRIAAGTGHSVLHNSVNLFGLRSGTAISSLLSAALIITGTGQTGCDVRNNILSNTISGGTTSIANVALCLPSGGTSSMNLTLNNNAYYSGTDAARQGIAQVGTTAGTGFYLASNFNAAVTTPSTNLRAYTSTLSAAGTNDNASFSSTSAAPFTSSTDLHIPAATSTLLESGGASVGVTTDIDGDARPNGLAPDIGADEFSGTNPNVCSGAPTAGTITSNPASICVSGSAVLMLNGASSGVGISYQWKEATVPGGPYTNVGTNSTTYNTGVITAARYYVVEVTCAQGPSTSTTAEFTLAVNPPPTIMVSPPSGLICNPGGTAVTLTASGASTYAWAPATGLNMTTGAMVSANPAATTTYTVTGTDGNGCQNTAMVTVTVAEKPTVSATATPATICEGGNSQLQATAGLALGAPNTYSFAGSSGAYAAISGTSVTLGSQDDGYTGNLPIGFTFNYNGIAQTVFAASPNGLIQLGQTISSSVGLFTNALASNANIIAPLWDDNNMTGGNIQYLTTGSVGSRILTVQWTNMHVGGIGSATNPTISMQALLYEATGQIQFIYGSTSAALSSTTASIGISGNSGNYLSVTPLSPANTSTVSSVTENTSISSAANFPSGTTYTFTPASNPITYAWSPATFLNDANIANPLATAVTGATMYTVTATVTGSGCTNTAQVNVNINPAPSATVSGGGTVCSGDPLPNVSFALTGTGPWDLTYNDGTNNVPVTGINTSPYVITNAPAGTYTVVSVSDANCPGTGSGSAAVAVTPATTWYADTDNDGFGDPAVSQTSCTQPVGYVANNTDLCPADPNKQAPGACGCGVVDVATIWYADTDGDTYGDPNNSIPGFTCNQPVGYVANNTDLCPADPNKQASGACGCGVVDVATTWYADTDGDTYGDPNNSIPGFTCNQPSGYVANNTDCDDTRFNVNPAAVEICDGLDNNCNGSTDEGVLTTYYADTDGDGYGNPNISTMACSQPTGFVTNNGDCDDSNPNTYAGYTVVTSGSYAPISGTGTTVVIADDQVSSVLPIGFSFEFYGANYTNFYISSNGFITFNPSSPSGCCSGQNIPNTSPPNNLIAAAWDDLYPAGNGNINYFTTGTAPNRILVVNYVNIPLCCGANPAVTTQILLYETSNRIEIHTAFANGISPGTMGIENASGTLARTIPGRNRDSWTISNDFVAFIPCSAVVSTFYRDMDGDGFGDPLNTTTGLTPPPGYVTDNTDCNDNNIAINPGAAEICNGIDDDCDGSTDEGLTFITYYTDADGDGYGTGVGQSLCANPGLGFATQAGDCNDNNDDINPGAAEICNGIDDDCDGSTDEGLTFITYYTDADGDGYGTGVGQSLCANPGPGFATQAGDCNDNNDDINPAATEICNGIDDDCDGSTDEGVLTTYYLDADGDGYYTGAPVTACTSPGAGYVTSVAGGGDCNDGNNAINPGVSELCNGIDDNCNGSTDEGFDADNDGIADCFDNCPNTPNSVIRPIAIDGNIGDFGAPIANGNAGVNYYFSADNTYFYIGVTGVNLGNDNLHIAFSNADGSNNGTNWGVNWSNTPYTYLITIFGPDDICYYPFNDPNGCQQVGNGGGQWQHFAGWSGNPTTEIRIPRAFLGSLNGGSGLVNLTIYSNNNGGTFVWTGYPTSNPQGNAPVTWNSFGQQAYPTYLPQVDADNDSFGAACDCNDNNANINPNATEVCNGIDDDCDGMIDEGLTFTTYYVDNDGDGFGTGNGQSLCSNPGAGFSTVAGDCNDNNANIKPGATEVCDGIDNDCDGMIDEGLSFITYYVDNDGDGFGTGNGQSLCSNPGAGFSTVAGDCNDNNPDINPNAAEVCDGIDNDCDGLVDSADPNYVDNTLPTITCASQATVNFNGQTSIQIDGPNSPVNLQIVANDNCGTPSVSISPSSISASQVGQSVPVTITATDGKGNTAQCVTTVNVTGLPAGWSATPGGVGCAGGNNAGYNTANGTWTVTSTNCFYGPPFTGDSEAFAQRTLCGDGSITALITGINPLAGGWAGIVMRESNAAGAKKAQLMTNLGFDHRREFRTITNGAVTPQQFSSLGRYWLRIVRAGNQFTMFVSSNGSSWFPAGAQIIAMNSCIEMGLIVTNYTSNSTVTATFSNVSFTQPNPIAGGQSGIQPTLGQVEFDVFPNPTSGELNLDLTQYIGRSVRIETYSLEGKLLQFAELDEVQHTLERLDLSRFQNGMYLVKVKSAGLPDVTRRIVKQ